MARILVCVYFRTFPFLVDPGTGIPIKNGLCKLGKKSAIYVAHVKLDCSQSPVFPCDRRCSCGFINASETGESTNKMTARSN